MPLLLDQLKSLLSARTANRPRRFHRLRSIWEGRTTRRRLIHARLRPRTTGATATSTAAQPMRFWENGWIDLTRHEIPIGLQRPLRVLHLSDLHASRVISLGYLQRVIELGLEHQPELICLTGDFITWKYRAYDSYAAVLARLSAAAPTFACLGNHDGGPWAAKGRLGYDSSHLVRQLLRQAGVTLLHNRGRTVRIADQALNLVGVGDPWSEECRPDLAFAGSRDGRAPTVVLSHNPDTKDALLAHDWSLMLSGHTHGGQVFLPGIGALLAPVRDKHCVRGLHFWNQRWVHITKGVGNLHGLRLNCRPEISLLTLT